VTTGIEQGATGHNPTARRPPRYKMAIINWISIYPLITFLLWAGRPLIQRLPVAVTTLVLSMTLVSLMTFVVMPLMTRLFSGWLGTSRTRARV
jgi:antibiotic biosynthesis monooxygenase (ABM) superfamily enzyme